MEMRNSLSYSQSVVILDNASIHYVTGVVDSVQTVGGLTYYLPKSY